MSPRARTVSLLALAVPAAWMLVVLQADVTNLTGFSVSLVQDYADGTIGTHWTDGVPPIIWQARVLVRGIILAVVATGVTDVQLANLIIQAAFVAAALIVIYRSTMTFATSGGAMFAAALTVAAVPWGFLSVGYRVSYPYDLPALFFSAAGLAAIVTRRFEALLAVIVLGTLNKETTVFLIPAYCLAAWPNEARRTLFWRTLMLVLAFAITYEVPRLLLQPAHSMLITVHTQAGAGSRIGSNLDHLFHGNPGGFLEHVAWVAMLHVPALLSFRRLPWGLRAAYFATPVFIVPTFLFANAYELRLYNELIPLGAMAGAAVLAGSSDAGPDPQKNPKPVASRRHVSRRAS